MSAMLSRPQCVKFQQDMKTQMYVISMIFGNGTNDHIHTDLETFKHIYKSKMITVKPPYNMAIMTP